MPSLRHALIPVLFLIGALFAGIFLLEASPHLPLILACCVAGITGIKLGYSWKDLQSSMVRGISLAMAAVLILMAIGILIGSWVASGIVPLMVYYGLMFLSPEIFLVASCLICAVVSFATGSSWSTAGRVGVALIGAGQGLEMPLPMVAGAIVSGAYFGDKLSPLSDSTNLAPAVAGTQLFVHIKHMLYTTVPSLVIALALYGILGMSQGSSAASIENVEALNAVLRHEFNLSPWLWLAPISVILMIALRIPALPALLGGAFVGAALGIFLQDIPLESMIAIMQEGYISDTGDPLIDELLSRGGLESMFWTISLILCAMAFGGLMEGAGMLAAISRAVLKTATTTGRLVGATLATCIGMNIMAPDQYLSIILPGRMYRNAFEKEGLHMKNLSRSLEDAGTLSSPLIPWNTCGATMMAALMVNPFAYLPFAFLNLLNPIISMIYGFTGWTMEKAEEGEME
ncbi:MAG: Na+/H+ antiporter NhaC [Opitutae bacterium]|nr:Na+/H+ antiporter NhaC [Opitutae bacterium]